MKRVVTWAFYAIGAIAIAYLALYAYVVLTGRNLQPGEPIRIFRKPDAPSYSAVQQVVVSRLSNCADLFSFRSPTREEEGMASGRCHERAMIVVAGGRDRDAAIGVFVELVA
jgi:hypothetical protein